MHRALRHAWGTRCGNALSFSSDSGRPSPPRSPQSLHNACDSHVPLQVDRRNKNGGRENVGNKLIQRAAQAPRARLPPLVHAPIEHALTCGWPDGSACSSHRTFSSSASRTVKFFGFADTWAFGCAQRRAGIDARRPLREARWPRALDANTAFIVVKKYLLVRRVCVR